MTSEIQSGQQTKRCSKCSLEKTFDEFYLSTRSKDGRQVKCKACEVNYRIANKEAIKARKAAYHISNREVVLEKLRQYRAKNAKRNREREKARYVEIKSDPQKYAKYRKTTRISKKASNLRHPDHVKAHSAVLCAIRSGKMARPNQCSNCGNQCKPEAHHDNYEKSQWLVVRWLCQPCHRSHHRKYPDQPK